MPPPEQDCSENHGAEDRALGDAFEGDAVTLAFELGDSAPASTIRFPSVVVVETQLAVGRLILDDMVGGDEQCMGDSPERLLLAAMTGDAVIAGRESGILGVPGGMGGEDQRAPQPAVAFADARGAMLARTLVLSRTEASPTADMTVSGEHAHVQAE